MRTRSMADYIAASIVFVVAMVIGLWCQSARAEVLDAELLTNAIYKAEGEAKAKVPYGILSVKVKDGAEARRVCINTINNNMARWQWARQNGDKRDYIKFLSDRYCPVGANNDNGTNKYWESNVKQFYGKMS